MDAIHFQPLLARCGLSIGEMKRISALFQIISDPDDTRNSKFRSLSAKAEEKGLTNPVLSCTIHMFRYGRLAQLARAPA